MSDLTGIFAALLDQATLITWAAVVVLSLAEAVIFGYWCHTVYWALRDWTAREDREDERD